MAIHHPAQQAHPVPEGRDGGPPSPFPFSEAGHQVVFSAFEHAAIGMSIIDPFTFARVRVNAAFARLLGYTVEEMLALKAFHVTHPDDIAEDLRQRARCIDGVQHTYELDKRYLHRDGHVVWARLTCTLVRDGSGRPLHYIGQMQDISERKKAEQALRESEERFRSLSELSSDWYWEQDEQLRFTSIASEELQNQFGDHQVIGLCRWELQDVTPLSGSWEEHRRTLEERRPFRNFTYFRRLDSGAPSYVTVSGEPMFDPAGRFRGYRGTAREVTEAVLADQRVRTARTMIGLAARIGRLGAWTLDEPGRPLAWSDEVCAIHGVAIGFAPTLEQAIAFHVPEVRGRVRQLFEACLREGAAFDVESELVTADGRRVWVRTLGEAELDGEGRVLRIQGAMQDISESQKARLEILRLNAELEERVRQRTAALEAANRELESFSYSIAHDLRAPLSSIDGFSQVLQESASGVLQGRHLHYLQRIRKAVRHMGELTDGLLALANLSRASLRREPVDLAVLARATIELLRQQSPQRQVELAIPGTLPARGDPRLLSQVMVNLLGNAWKFTARTPHPRIELGAAQEQGESVYFVRDNGAGFDMAYAGKLFDAFQRLHAASEFEGTGIGLAIVQRIVARHGGRIWADAAPGQGACFKFTLPDGPHR